MINWDFPITDGGDQHSLNNPGEEHFKDDPILSLTREIIQNSIDASNSDDPVKVQFKRMDLPISELPGIEEFKKVIEKSIEYYSEGPTKSVKTKDFLCGIERIINNETISVLKASDFNTTGLTDSDNPDSGSWLNLTKIQGNPDKDGESGGSFGIGKGAPFACSLIRTVFYATKDKHQKEAFQGVARLVTHKKDDQKTQGTGFYGEVTGKLPITDREKIKDIFRRTEIGTDVYIFGFINTKPDFSNWEEKVCRAILEDFFVALHNNTLSVEISDENGTSLEINQDTLPELLGKYSKEKGFKAHHFYQAIVSNPENQFHFSESFKEGPLKGMGEVTLDILAKKGCPKRIAMHRGTGMKIYARLFQSHMEFTGVFQATGKKINQALKAMENPPHTKWVASRYDDPREGKKILNSLVKWIGEKIDDIASRNIQEEVDFEGMQEFLPDDLDEKDEKSESSLESSGGGNPISDESPELNTEPPPSEKPKRDPIEISKTPPSKRVTTGEGESGGVRPREKGNKKRGKKDAPPGPKGNEQGRKPFKLKQARILSSNYIKGEYRIMFVPESDGHGPITFKAATEEESLDLQVESALNEFGESIPIISGGTVGPLEVKKNTKSFVNIRLKEPLRCSLEVSQSER